MLLMNSFITAQCPTDLNFNSQADIDNFATDYPGCTQITGDVIIQGNTITSLDGLNGITHIGGRLQIIIADNLTNVDGLSSLVSIGTFIDIYLNDSLTDLSGLANVVFGPGFGSIVIEANSNLSVCNVPNICRYFANPSAFSYIEGNGQGCATIPQLRSSCITPDANGILYVKKDALGNGTSWTDALGEVSEAFAEAQTDLTITQIWVAKGTYSATGAGLRMRNNLEIYGGFDPDNGIVDLGDTRISPTATTGSILTGDNVRRVVTNMFTNSSPLDATAVLNGFTITKGNPPHTAQQLDIADSGGGILNQYASPKLINLFVIDNYANDRGGGIYNNYSNPTLVNTVVARNSAQYSGGGIYNLSSPMKMINSTIAHNHSERVGGIRNNGTASQVVMTNCIVSGNTKTATDPENVNLSNIGSATITYQHTFVQNITTADAQGNIDGTLDPLLVNPAGNNFRLQRCSPMINSGTNTAFAAAQTPDLSSVTIDLAGSPRIFNSQTVDLGAYEYQADHLQTQIVYVDANATGNNNGSSWANAYTDLQSGINAACTNDEVWVAKGEYQPAVNQFFKMKEGVRIHGGFAGTESILAARNWRTNVTVLKGNNNSVVRNECTVSNPMTSASVLDGFTVTGGLADQSPNPENVLDAGGGIFNLYASPKLVNLIITNNTADDRGGGLYNRFSNPLLVNSVVSRNTANRSGGGIYNFSSSPKIVNATIANNAADRVGGIRSNYIESVVLLQNSIVYGNMQVQATQPEQTNISNLAGATIQYSYSLVQDTTTADAQGNLPGTLDPVFTDPVTNNYRLQANSPVIDTANNTLIPADVTTDLDSSDRIIGLSADMGAYEYQGSPCPFITTWNGTAWSNGLPDEDTKIIFDGDYTSDSTNTDSGLLEGCSVEVLSGDVVISDGHNLVLDHEIAITGGSFHLKNNAGLVQVEDDALNKGAITSERITPPIYRYDYVYWSSPVTEDSGFFLGRDLSNPGTLGLSPLTLFDKYHSWDAGQQEWSTIPYGNEAMVLGKGYIVRAPQNYGTDPLEPASYHPFTANFIGKPNNGMVHVPIAGGVDQWNLIGNPYPSAFYVDAFLYENNTVVDGTVYIWNHTTGISNNGSGAVYYYDGGDYAVYNLSGGVGTGTGDDAPNGSAVPSGYIASGQSFFIKGNTVGGTAHFNNSLRVAAQNDQFFRPVVQSSSDENAATTGKHRIWLNLKGTQNAFKQAMIGYIESATNDLDWGYDGETFGSNAVSLYSVLGDKTLTIQGRALPFEDEDEVPLGYKTALAGTLTISIDHLDGLFEEQPVYLEDTVLGTVHDLKASDYTFTTVAGTFNERFVLRYLPASDLGNGGLQGLEQSVLVAKVGNELLVRSASEALESVTVYDLLGRMILHKTSLESNEIRLADVVLNRQTLIVKVVLANGVAVSRKLIY